jgi:hypothetical protein
MALSNEFKGVSKKILLFEMDIGTLQDFFTNDVGFGWFFNINGLYPLITSLTGGLPGETTIENIGSVTQDNEALIKADSVAQYRETPGSWYIDLISGNVYIRCTDSNEPSLHKIFLGVVYAFSNSRSAVYNGVPYRDRIKSAPTLQQKKDLLYFGKISFMDFTIDINNENGDFDSFGEDNKIFGQQARILIGFEDEPYSSFRKKAEGFIETLDINNELMTISVRDKRKQLARGLPINTFDQTTYPDLDDNNVGKAIPMGYGTIKGGEAICTNDTESPTPGFYHFKFLDTEFAGIKVINEIRVDGEVKTAATSSYTNATFSLSAANYTPGQSVEVDFIGYVNDSSEEIANGLDVLLHIFTNYTNLIFNESLFNTSAWLEATEEVSDVGLYISDSIKIYDVVQKVAASIQTDVFVQPDGRWTAVKFDIDTPAVQEIKNTWVFNQPNIGYNPAEVTTTTEVFYANNYTSDIALRNYDKSREEELIEINNFLIVETFNTILTTGGDAQLFSDTVLDISSLVQKQTTIEIKTQLINRQITDFIIVPLVRKSGDFLGRWRAEIIGTNFNTENFKERFVLRLVERLVDPIYEPTIGYVYGDKVYGDKVYGITGQEQIN